MSSSLIGVLVNEQLGFMGVLIRDKNKNVVSLSEFGMMGGTLHEKYGLNVKYNFIGDYVALNNKYFVDCPLFDKNANAILNKMELRYILKSTSKGNPIVGGVVYFEGLNKEMKCKINDLAYLISYCNATNFTLSKRNNSLFLKGKNGCKLENLPIIIERFDCSGGFNYLDTPGSFKI